MANLKDTIVLGNLTVTGKITGDIQSSGGTSMGSVTSVGLSVPTGLTVTGSPITSSGTLAVSLASGYSIPLANDVTKGVTAHGWGNHADQGYLTSNSLSGYATQTWVQSQGYLTGLPSRLGGYNATVNNAGDESGWYWYNDTSNSSAKTAFGNSAQAAVFTSAYSNTWAGQIGISYYSNQIAFRKRQDSSTWGDWIELAKKTDIPSSLPASGGTANALAITGFGNNSLTYNQLSGDFYGNNGWCHYIICNHNDGASYYNYVIGLPFWSAPMYKRQTGSTSNISGWHSFITSENIGSYISGTSGYVPKFTGDNAIGNSSLTFDNHDSLKINSGGTSLRIGNLNGSNSKEWIHMYTDGSSSKGLITDTNISSTNGTSGTADYPWKGLYLNGNISTSAGGDIGGQPAANRFSNLYLTGGVNASGTSSMQTINCSTISGTVSLFDTYKSYSSYGTGQYSGRIKITASSQGWVLSGDGAYYGGDDLQSLRPQTSNYGRIGCDAYRFYETWVHNVKTYTILPISQTASSGNTSNTGNIGNSSYYFANMWSYKINFSTTGSISDRRLKENIHPTNLQALDIIKQLSISEFQYKAKLKKDKEIKKQREQARKKLAQLPKTAETKELRKELNAIISQRNTETEFEIGLIAQELEDVIPAQYRPAFITKEDTVRNSGEYSIKLNSVIYMAIKAIQEQQSIIETQQKKIDILEEKISRLELIVLGDK